MLEDPIVEEFRQAGDAYAASFGYDLDAIVQDLRRREEEHRERLVSLSKPEPDSKALQEMRDPSVVSDV